MLEYASPEGPTVTHARGMLLVNSINTLKELGVYEQYLETAPPALRAMLTGLIASSWVEVELMQAHYTLAETLIPYTEAQIETHGGAVAARIAETWFGAAIRAARTSGFDPMAFLLQQNDRTFQRMYRGGSCLILEYGPKDMVIEDHGNPLLGARHFRIGYNGYMKALANLFCRKAFVKPVRPLRPGPFSYATRFNWV